MKIEITRGSITLMWRSASPENIFEVHDGSPYQVWPVAAPTAPAALRAILDLFEEHYPEADHPPPGPALTEESMTGLCADIEEQVRETVAKQFDASAAWTAETLSGACAAAAVIAFTYTISAINPALLCKDQTLADWTKK